MVSEKQLERLRLLGLVGGADEDLRGLVERHSILLGKLAADPYIGSILLGMESARIGEVVIARATSNLTLSTSAQSIVGDGDSSKVRLILPTTGDWIVFATCDLVISATGTGGLIGELFVDDSGSAKTGFVILDDKGNNIGGTISQHWKVTTTTGAIPVELKARKASAGGTGTAHQPHTVLAAIRAR